MQQPVIFFIDDLQWADTSTLALLGYLTWQASGPIFFLAATQPVPARSPFASLLQTLTREDRLFRLSLGPLDAVHITAIVHNLGPQSQHREVLSDWLIRSSEGTPYVLAELVRHARDNGLITAADGPVNLSAFSGSPIVPQSIYTLIQARLNCLSEAARHVLDVLGELLAVALVRPRNQTTEAPATRLLYTFDQNLTLVVAFPKIPISLSQ